MATEGTNDMLAVPVGERDHTRGSESAPVTLVQYGDYECPYTRRSQPIVRGLEQRLGERLRFVFRHFPLSRIHLRVCLVCGHVGCCDNSKNRHATGHFHTTGHPIIQSFEPGEDWLWCY